MKVAQVSTWKVRCGIATYTQNLVDGLSQVGQACDVVPIERQLLKYMSRAELKEYFINLAASLNGYDVIHVQHEFGFFGASYSLKESIEIFSHFLDVVSRNRQKTFITFHTEPPFMVNDPAKGRGVTGSIKDKLKEILWKSKIVPYLNKSYIQGIVHTKNSRRLFIDSGFNSASTQIIKHGVVFSPSKFLSPDEKEVAKENLGFSKDAILLSMFGFISPYKGYKTALRALKFLPDNYHLLIMGGSHPHSKEKALDGILSFLNRNKALAKRVRLTGYLEIEQLKEYHNAIDYCLAPYEPKTQLSASGAVTWALSSGKPVIASNISAFEELNEEAKCLHLVTPGAPGELAYRILELSANEALKNELVNNALLYCETNQWSNVAKQHIEMYKR